MQHNLKSSFEKEQFTVTTACTNLQWNMTTIWQ